MELSEEKSPKNRILQAARQLFLERGFSNVTMDELAFELGISKKTLYQHFSSKKALLREAMFCQMKIVQDGLRTAVECAGEGVIERLHAISLYMAENLPRPSRAFLEDMRRNAPDLWKEIDKSRTKTITTHFRQLFEDGKREGVIREGLDVDFVLHSLISMLQGMVNPEMLSKLPMTAGQTTRRIIELLTLGVLTEEGRSEYGEPSDTLGEEI